MLGEVVVVGDRIECWRIEFGERRMGVLAMKTFLKAIDHSFPVKSAFVRYTPPMWKHGKVHGVRECL